METPVSDNQQLDSTATDIENAVASLGEGARRLITLSSHERRRLIRACIAGVTEQSTRWVEDACAAKQIPQTNGARAEEILTGPVCALRYLHLLHHTLSDIERCGEPQLPGSPYERDGRLRVPVFPTSHLFDTLLFRPMRAETWMQDGVHKGNLFGANIEQAIGKGLSPPQISGVLGAGNVSSIPITDALSKLFQTGSAVLLKMNPVNDYLGPIFARAFAPLVDEDLLRIVYGGADVGSQIVNHSAVTDIHVTGSEKTHDAIVWGSDAEQQHQRKANGQPLFSKPITSELGNVSPWIVVPGRYSERELRFQAENIVASITNNASFNCVATKMLITWRQWDGRQRFLDQIESILGKTERRCAYYPGAVQRFERFAGRPADRDESKWLPWTLLRNVEPERQPELFYEESFVCVCAETTLAAATEEEFLSLATAFANDRIWGTLAAALTVPSALQRKDRSRLDEAIGQLRYGTIGVNQWPGVAFPLMSPPWGGFPGTTWEDVQSGIGHVHGTYLLDRPEKTVLSSPLTMLPKPIWFSTHRCPEAVAWRLMQLYSQPTLGRLMPVLWCALRG